MSHKANLSGSFEQGFSSILDELDREDYMKIKEYKDVEVRQVSDEKIHKNHKT